MPLDAPVIRMVFCRHESRWPPHQCGKSFLSNRASRGYGAAAFHQGNPALERAMSVEIVPVQSKADWHDFHHLPFGIYAR